MTVRDVMVEAYKEALPALAASLIGDLVADVVLGGMWIELRAVPRPPALVSALLTARGNVYDSLGARVATALHQGLIEPRVTGGDKRLWTAVTAALVNGVFISMFVVIVAYSLLTFLSSRAAPLPILTGVAAVADLFSGIVLTAVVVSVVFTDYHRGHNPDTIVGPVVMTTGGVFGVLFLLVAVRTVLTVTGAF